MRCFVVLAYSALLTASLFGLSSNAAADPFRSGFEEGESPCPLTQPADACGICGGDGSACVCSVFEAVGYPGDGNTCNLFGDTVWPDGEPNLPAAALDEYTYNEILTGEGHELPFNTSGGVFFQDAVPGDTGMGDVGRANGCGACILVTGVNGSRVFYVREIADVNAVASNGIPRNVHLDNDAINDVRVGSGKAVDVTVQPVPCPFSGTIQLKARGFTGALDFNWVATYFTPYQSVYPIKKMEIRAEEAHDQWYDLPKDWTNRYLLDNVNDPGAPDGWRGVQIPIPDPPSALVRFRITSVYDQVLITPPIQLSGGNLLFYDLGVQFQPRQYTLGACEITTLCGNKQLDAGEACEPALEAANSAACNPSTCQYYP